MRKYNWIIEPVEVNANPTNWCVSNKVKVYAYMKKEDSDLGNGWKLRPVRIVPTRNIYYIAVMTEEEVSLFKLSTSGMTIKRAKW